MGEGLCGSGYIDLVCGKKKQIASCVVHKSVEDDGNKNSHADHVKGIVCLIDQNFIHNDLEKQWNDQGEDGKHQHHECNLTEDPFVFDEFRDEPAETEGLFLIGEFVDLFEKDEFPGITGGKFTFREEYESFRSAVLRGVRIENGDLQFLFLVFSHAAYDSKIAVGFFDDTGEYGGTLFQIFPGKTDIFCLEAVTGNDLKEEIVPDFLFPDSIFMHDLPDIHLGIVMAGNLYETGKFCLFSCIHLSKVAEDDTFA